MDWIELNVRVAPALEPQLVVALENVASGVATEHPGGYIGEPGEPHDLDPAVPLTVKAYFSAEEDAMGGAELARGILGLDEPSEDVFLRFLPEEDWASLWKRYFGLQRISQTLVIVPTWKTYRPRPAENVIRLDPGLAFGTGQHPTTRLCLAAIERLTKPGDRVLDVGAGSGILSICAALCGADRVIGLDLDAATIEAAEANAELNDVSSITTFRAGSLAERWPADLPPAGDFDVVVANISTRTILNLSSALGSALRPGGILLASGFLQESVAEVRGALTEAGLTPGPTRRRREWRLVEAVKP
jgi:ribosomal protein L11 methyltransferase